MPSDLILDVEDGSGGIEITNVSSPSLSNGSGPIQIEDISGNVDVCGVPAPIPPIMTRPLCASLIRTQPKGRQSSNARY